jgi:hypothetical protein
LVAVGRLRRLELDIAQRDLAACLHAEVQAIAAQDAAQADIRRETAVATSPSADIPALAVYAAWLPHAMAAAARAASQQSEREQASAAARLNVAEHQSAARATGFLLDARAEARRVDVLRREQAALDEHAQRRPAAAPLITPARAT